jgi:hypothetical protein
MTFPLNIAVRNINILSWDACLGLHVLFLCTFKWVYCQLLTVHKVFEIAFNNFNQTRKFHMCVCVYVAELWFTACFSLFMNWGTL